MNKTINGYRFVIDETGVYLKDAKTSNLIDDSLIEAISSAREIWERKFGGVPMHLYFMSSEVPNVVKIGVSKDPDKRVSQVGANGLINSIPFRSPAMARRYESALHRFFVGQLYVCYYEREWFTLTDEQLYQVVNARSEYDLCKLMGVHGLYTLYGKRSSFDPGQYIENIHPKIFTRREIEDMGGGYVSRLEATNGHKEDA